MSTLLKISRVQVGLEAQMKTLSKRVCKTKCGMMPADTELTKQLPHMPSLNSSKTLYKIYQIQENSEKTWKNIEKLY